MRVSHEAVTTVLGPGKRYVIWTQGCLKRCPGCINPEGRDMLGGTDIPVAELFARITDTQDIVGITVSGGEPFLQIVELADLIRMLKDRTQLDVMIYTGYTVKALKDEFGAAFDAMTENIDILVEGEYIESQNTGSMYRGSDNQRIICYTDKYRQYLEAILASRNREFAFEIDTNGDIYFIGIPPVGFYEMFLKEIAREEIS